MSLKSEGASTFQRKAAANKGKKRSKADDAVCNMYN